MAGCKAHVYIFPILNISATFQTQKSSACCMQHFGKIMMNQDLLAHVVLRRIEMKDLANKQTALLAPHCIHRNPHSSRASLGLSPATEFQNLDVMIPLEKSFQ